MKTTGKDTNSWNNMMNSPVGADSFLNPPRYT